MNEIKEYCDKVHPVPVIISNAAHEFEMHLNLSRNSVFGETIFNSCNIYRFYVSISNKIKYE